MKRSVKVLAGSLAAVLVLGSVLPVMDSHAGQRTEIVEDTFDNGSLLESYDSEIWSQYSESDPFRIKQLTKPTRALQFKGKNENGEATVLMTKDWYWEIHSLTFDLKIPRNASWFGLDFPDIIEPLEYVGDYQKQGEPMCYNSFKVGPEDDFGLTATQWTDWGFSSNKLSDTWVSVKIVPENENTGMIYLAPKGSAFPMSKGQKITLAEGQSFHNSNIVFIDYAFTGYMIDNVEIKTDMGVYQENFEDESDDLFELVTLHEGAQNFSMQIVEDGAIRKMSLSKAKAGEQLVANKEIKASDKYLDDDSEVLRTTFSLDMSNSKSDEELAFVFGIPSNGAEAFYNSWAYIISRAGGRLVRFNEEGKEVVKAKHSASFTSGTVGLTLKKDGSLQVLQNGSVVLRVSGVKNYQGYAGFAARTAIGKAIYIDNVLIENEIYHIVTTKTFSDDFKTNRLGTVGNSDYAYWAESGSINVTGGELTFDGCLDNTYFGAGYEYETYEMSFQLKNVSGTSMVKDNFNHPFSESMFAVNTSYVSLATVEADVVEDGIDFNAYGAPTVGGTVSEATAAQLDEAYADMAAAGFTKAIAMHEGWSDATGNTLLETAAARTASADAAAALAIQAAEANDILYYVKDTSFYNLGKASSDSSVIDSDMITKESDFKSVIETIFGSTTGSKSYLTSSAYAGHFAADEPTYKGKDLTAVKYQTNYYNAQMNTLGVEGEMFVNLFGAFYAKTNGFLGIGNYDYTDYIESYLENGGKTLGYFSWDNYPFVDSAKETESGSAANHLSTYLYNYEYLAGVAKANNNMELRNMVQAMGDGTGVRELTGADDLRFQIYSGLAFGVKEFTYYQYSNSSTRNDKTTGFLYEYSTQETTETYDWAKEVNNEVHAIEGALDEYQWSKSYVIDNGATNEMISGMTSAVKTNSTKIAMSTGGDILASEFTAKQSDNINTNAYMFVNVEYNNASGSTKIVDGSVKKDVAVTFPSGTTALSIYQGGKQKIVPISDASYTFSIGGGEGVFVIPLS